MSKFGANQPAMSGSYSFRSRPNQNDAPSKKPSYTLQHSPDALLVLVKSSQNLKKKKKKKCSRKKWRGGVDIRLGDGILRINNFLFNSTQVLIERIRAAVFYMIKYKFGIIPKRFG